MPESRSMVVISAHAADFVWRAAGVVALHTDRGGRALVVSLSFGERGESGDLWKEPGQTVERVRTARRADAQAAADALGAEFLGLDLGDYPLVVGGEAEEELRNVLVGAEADVVLVHAPNDPFNPDHPVASAASRRAVLLATGAGGVAAAFPTITPPTVYAFEPHQPDLSGFAPNTFVNVTAVWERKRAAMAAMSGQTYLVDHYSNRASQRAYQARYLGFGADVERVEAFERLTPTVAETL